MLTYLGLGSNLGNKEQNIKHAIQLIAQKIGSIVRQSSLYYSEPMGFQSDNQFVNAVILVDTVLEPEALLLQTKEIELEMGRTNKSTAGIYQDRIIDIDILLYENLFIDLPDLQIPHPRMFERDFVLKPLSEILD